MYNLCIAYILYRFYIEFNFSKYLYDIDPRKIYSLNIIEKILLLAFPTLLIINLIPLFNILVKLYIEKDGVIFNTYIFSKIT